MVGPSAYTENLQGAQPTVQNLNIVEGYDPQQTMPSASVYDEQAASAATYDEGAQYQPQYYDDAPTYDDEDEVPEIYEREAARGKRRLMTVLVFGVFGLFACALVSGITFIGLAYNWYNQTVDPYRSQILALANYQPDFQIARVMDATGTEIMTLTSQDGAREPIRIEGGGVSPFFVHAVVSSEDPTYYENPGLNVLSIGRAFWQNLTAGEIQSGASTITQQIASSLVLEDRSQTAERKATEIAIALEIANTYSKNEVLDIYINEFPFGNQTFGVEAASQLYFRIPASDLDMAQSALLAGLLPAPESSNPVRDREAAFDAMNVIIERMIRTDCLNFQHGEWANGTSFCVNENTLVMAIVYSNKTQVVSSVVY
ncbi:MAG: biosynthetic peptidoglycan transglycosylase [Anaerolineae bacterium]|nr:biosynthetic peptidoglycan transglycosylase [Anaerolineae bacterium]